MFFLLFFFFFNDTAPTEIYTLSLHDALPICMHADEAGRQAALMADLSRHKNMTVGEMLEEIFLHSFEKVPSGGVASPHTEKALSHIKALKEKDRKSTPLNSSPT